MSRRYSIYDGDDNPGAILGTGELFGNSLPRGINVGTVSGAGIGNSQQDTGVWAGSDHPGLMHVVLGDGSGFAINTDVDLTVIEQFVTRDGGEAISLSELK